jgi:hypothetical protein
MFVLHWFDLVFIAMALAIVVSVVLLLRSRARARPNRPTSRGHLPQSPPSSIIVWISSLMTMLRGWGCPLMSAPLASPMALPGKVMG